MNIAEVTFFLQVLGSVAHHPLRIVDAERLRPQRLEPVSCNSHPHRCSKSLHSFRVPSDQTEEVIGAVQVSDFPFLCPFREIRIRNWKKNNIRSSGWVRFGVPLCKIARQQMHETRRIPPSEQPSVLHRLLTFLKLKTPTRDSEWNSSRDQRQGQLGTLTVQDVHSGTSLVLLTGFFFFCFT